MFSDGDIKVNNLTGKFSLVGPKSKLNSQNIDIIGDNIDGVFNATKKDTDIVILNVNDDKIAYIKTQSTDMYANTIKYDDKKSLITLENNVKIIRGSEKITGDYGTMDTKNNSYKVTSNNSNRVKVIISNKNE